MRNNQTNKKCPLCDQPFNPESAEDLFCPACVAQVEIDRENMIRCTVCNTKFLPDVPGETTCWECFEDIAQANQPSQPSNSVKS